jgi:hypothetical protein
LRKIIKSKIKQRRFNLLFNLIFSLNRTKIT